MDKELANLESDSSINFHLLPVPSVKIKKTPLESNQISLIRYTRRVKERVKGNPQRSCLGSATTRMAGNAYVSIITWPMVVSSLKLARHVRGENTYA